MGNFEVTTNKKKFTIFTINLLWVRIEARRKLEPGEKILRIENKTEEFKKAFKELEKNLKINDLVAGVK